MVPSEQSDKTPSNTSSGGSSDEIPGLFSSSPYAILALLGSGTGCVAVGSIGLEILTDRWLAQTMDLGVTYLSLPLGIATLVLGGLTAADKQLWAVPSLLFGLVYFLLFWLA
ncbi:MAG: hypothetical protein ACQEVA_20990 [Myxococcota bacterium]